jgi:anti-sigma factor RsiW
MTWEDTHILLHALIDGELDAGNAREVEAEAASYPRWAAQLRDYRQMHAAMSAPGVPYQAPERLRRRIEITLATTALPAPRARAPSRRILWNGFAMGSVVSAALAACLVLFVVHTQDDQRIVGDVVSAHLRSLQGDHLIDVQSTDQHTVKPWFNGRLDLAPPVIDLTPQGFMLIGGRLDYIDGRPVAAIVYKRRAHVINLFVSPSAGSGSATTMENLQGFTVWSWASSDLGFRAVSDINPEELQEFGEAQSRDREWRELIAQPRFLWLPKAA